MLDPKEIDIEIARLEYGESSYPAYAKLATLYTIKNQMNRTEQKQPESVQAYSLASAPDPSYTARHGDSEFLRGIEGRDQEDVFHIMDDLLDTLQVSNLRVENGGMRKSSALETEGEYHSRCSPFLFIT